MYTIFMTSKSSNPHIILLYLTNKRDLTKKDKYIALSNLSVYYITLGKPKKFI